MILLRRAPIIRHLSTFITVAFMTSGNNVFDRCSPTKYERNKMVAYQRLRLQAVGALIVEYSKQSVPFCYFKNMGSCALSLTTHLVAIVSHFTFGRLSILVVFFCFPFSIFRIGCSAFCQVRPFPSGFLSKDFFSGLTKLQLHLDHTLRLNTLWLCRGNVHDNNYTIGSRI